MYSSTNKARERAPIHKAEGLTPSERYLNSLCERSFLSLWSYAGIFRDQKRKGKGDGKELCDMLVVFGEHVLIFSDKHCSFPSTGSLDLDWKRWYKRAIKKSADQAWGAERWLKSNPDSIYLDRACTQPFPLEIPPANSAKFHLIVVAHGSEERCEAEFGGSGSLMLDSRLGQRGQMDELDSTPFTVGDLGPSRSFVHVITESALDILLQTLDTVSDFVSYLEKKEGLFRSDTAVFAPGEEDLLAFYLMRTDDNGKHSFAVKGDYNALLLEEGFWEEFCQNPQRLAQLEHNKISYAWDSLIEGFSHHALNATQYFTNHTELTHTEIGLRLMARESRLTRRLLMENVISLFLDTNDGEKRVRVFPPFTPGGPRYVFLVLAQPNFATYEQYREVRGNLLEAYLMVAKHKFPEALDIVGIASEPVRSGRGSSEDLLYLDARNWSDEMEDEAIRLQNDLHLLETTTLLHGHVDEYPALSSEAPKSTSRSKIGRNERCPCGSGQKYKHCHGRVDR